MNKFRGKALATILAAALVASSLPVTFASAKTRNAKGVLTKDPDNDEFWLVNGGDKSERSVTNFQNYIYTNGDAPLETSDHKDVDDPDVYSISHVSGDKLVSWDIGKDDDDDDKSKGDVKLSLRKSDSEGDETIAILYKGTYTDDNDNDIDVTASTKVTIHAVDENSTVIGDADDVTDKTVDDETHKYFKYDGNDPTGSDSPEIDGSDDDDDNFALKTTAGKSTATGDEKVIGETKDLAVFKAVKDSTVGGSDGCLAQWRMLPTISKDKAESMAEAVTHKKNDESDFLENSGKDGKTNDYGDYAYVLECNTASKNLEFADSALGTAGQAKNAAFTPDDAKNEIKNVTPTVASGVNGAVTIANASAADVWYTVNAAGIPTKIGKSSGTVTFDGTGSNPAALTDGDTVEIYEEDTTKTGSPKATAKVTYTYDVGEAATPAPDSAGIVTASVPHGASTASLTFKAKVTNAYKTQVKDDDDIKAKSKIEKKVLVDSPANGSDAPTYKIYKDDTFNRTVLSATNGTATVAGDAKKGSTNHDWSLLDINGGYIVKFTDPANAEVTVEDDASIDGIKGKIGTVTVEDAKKVGDIDLKAGTVKIEDPDVKVGDITTKAKDTVPEIDIDADNSVGTIKVKNDDSGSSEVDVTAGSVKAIDTKGSVELNGEDDDKPISIGTVSAKNITIDSNDGAVSVANMVVNEPSDDENGAEISLKGDQATIKSIDLAGYGVDVKTEDFQGSIPAPQNATADDTVFETTDEDDDVTVKGDFDVNEVTLEDDSKVAFDSKLSADEIDGSGTMYIGANKLYVGEDATGVLVRLTDSSIKAGDTVCTAASDAMDEDDLDFYGFTVKKNEGKNTDTFVVDQLKFAGLAMNKTSDKIVLNDSASYTASAYAPGTAMPEGYSIEFDMDDNSGVFELTDNGNGTAAVKCVDYDDTFAEENRATLIAYVVDEDGDEDDDYGEAECKLTALKTPEKNFVSDTNSDFSIAPGASYQFKITADAAPVMTAGTAGVVNVANVGMSGKDYFIKITATGAVGAKTGIYVNGTKLLVVTVGTSQTFKSDTTTNVTVKKGSSYQYGITTSDGKAPFFTVGSGNVFNVKANGHNGSTYFFKITATGKAGAQAGIYVNGTKVNVAKIG